MEVTVSRQPDKSQAELKIEISAQDFQPFIERAARTLTKDRPLKGFRAGKAPLNVVIEAFGTEPVLREAMEKAMQKFFVQAVIEENIEAISRPNITVDKLGLNEPFHFTAAVEVMPTVTLGDVATISLEKRSVTVSEADVERELTYIAKLRSTPIEVARGAQMGDTVEVDFEVTMNGKLIEGGESKNHPVHLGEGHFVPDFEKGLVGIAASQTRDFSITFPTDFANESLRGKKAEVHVKAHRVQQRVIPTIDDAFAATLGKFKNVADLREKMKANLTHDKEHKETDRYRGELTQALAKTATFGPIPAVLIEREIDQRLKEFSEMLQMQHKTLEDYMTEQGKTLAQVREDMKESAERAVKVALAIRAFAEKQDIKVTPQEIEEKVGEYLQQFRSPEEARRAIDPGELRDQIASSLRNQKTLEKLEELVSGTREQHPEKSQEKVEKKELD